MMTLGHALEDRRQRSTGGTPGGPEIHEHGYRKAEGDDFGIEIEWRHALRLHDRTSGVGYQISGHKFYRGKTPRG